MKIGDKKEVEADNAEDKNPHSTDSLCSLVDFEIQFACLQSDRHNLTSTHNIIKFAKMKEQ